MVQDNSLLEQSRHSEQQSLQQMQLSELQKIASALSSGGVGGNPAPSVGSGYSGGVGAMPTNMTSVPESQHVQSGLDMFGRAAAVGGLALSAGANGINQAASVSRSALDRTSGFVNKMQNSPFFAYKSIDWSRTSNEQAESIAMQSRHRVENAGMKLGASVGSMGMASLGGAMGSFAGPLGTIAGTVAGSAIGSLGGDQILKHTQTQQGYEKWLQQNSGRMINMLESNDGFGDGFDGKESIKMSKQLSKMNTKFAMGDDELFTMLNGVTDAGLMKSASNMEDFQKKFSGLVESIKSGAKMLNLSYEEMTNLYGDWNKMGVKTDGERNLMSGQTKTLSMVTGMGEGQAAQALSALLGQIVGGTTLDGTLGAKVAQEDIFMASTIREKNLVSEDALRVIENDYKSNDQAVAAAMSGNLKSGYGNKTIQSAAAAAMVQGEDGSVKIDKDKLDQLMAGMDSGKLSMVDLARMGGDNLQSGKFSRDFIDNFSTMSGDQMYQMMVEGAGSTGANSFANKMMNSQAKRDGVDVNNLLMNHGFAGSRNDAILFNEVTGAYGVYGDAAESALTNQNYANMIRNSSSSQMGRSLGSRIKYGAESVWQGAAAMMPSLDGALDSFTDFFKDNDSAIRNGYSSAAKKNIASNEYKDVFKDIENTSSKLDKEFKTNIKGDLTRKTGIDTKVAGGLDSFADILLSPSRWDTAVGKMFSGDLGDLTNTNLTARGDSVSKLIKKTNKSKTMSDKEKEDMINNINQASGQTQDMVAGALDVVTAFGGRGAREDMLDSITVDARTKMKTGAKSFDDFTNEKVLNKMSLGDQQKVQELAVEQATKQLTSKFGGNLDELKNMVVDGGYANASKGVEKILKDDKIDKSEIKSLVKELMTISQGGSGKSELNSLIESNSKDVAKSTKSANKNMDKVNKNMEDMADKLDGFADIVSDAIKNLTQRTNQLEATAKKF